MLLADFDLLKKSQVEVISLDTFINSTQNGLPLPEKWAVITFDDVTKGQFDYARPLLKEYKFPATFFAPTALVESGEPVISGFTGIMNWKELKALVDEGFQVASHGHTHSDLSALSGQMLKKEIRDSLLALASNLNVNEADVCLPFGLYRQEQEKLFIELGVRSIALTTTDHGSGEPGLMKIRRFEVKADTKSSTVLRTIIGAAP